MVKLLIGKALGEEKFLQYNIINKLVIIYFIKN